MAEIIQHETQEAQALKSKASPFTAKAHAPQPLREAGYNKRLEADNWGKAIGAVDKTARVVQAYSHAKDKIAANETMKLMQSDHANVMLKLAEHLPQTDLQNLDLQNTVANWENRHGEHSDGFRIGKSDNEGKATTKINSQRFEDYNIPHSQKDALEKYYNGLEKQKTDYLVQSLPEILIGKAKFQLGETTQRLKNQLRGITASQDSYQYLTPPGLDNLLDKNEEAYDLTGEEFKETQPPPTPDTVYTLNLTNEASQQVLDMFEEYDKELLEIMNVGVITAEEAIVFQRVFTQDVLEAMFDADKSRDEDGAYLKLANGGYHIDRNLLRGHSYSKKLQQKMHIDETTTSSFVNAYNTKKQKEEDKAAKLVLTNATKSAIETFTREVQKKESYDNMTYDEIVSGYVKAGAEEYAAKQYANTWAVGLASHLEGIVDNNVTFQLEALTAQIINDGEGFEKIFATKQPNGEVFSITGRPLRKAIETIAENRLRQKKWQRMSLADQKAVDPKNITLTREEITEIGKAAAKIKPANVQKMLNTRQANKKAIRKELLVKNIDRQTGSAIGRNDIKTRYGKFDEEREIYGPDFDKIDAVYKANGFESSKEMGIHLTSIFKTINTADAAAAKALANEKHVSSQFMTDDMFRKSMWADAQAKKELIANIAAGKMTQYAAFSHDATKSFFNVNAESYLRTPKGEKDANFKARYEKGGITGVLSKRQQNLKIGMDRSFVQLYGMEAALIPTKNTTKEVLEGYYLELQNNLSKTDVDNKYSVTISANIKERLRVRVQQLQRPNQKGTAFRQCYKDGDIDATCILAFEKAHGNPMASLPGSVTIVDIVNEMLYETGGLTEPMEDPEQTGQGVTP